MSDTHFNHQKVGDYSISLVRRLGGGLVNLTPELAYQAWEDTPLCQHRTFGEWSYKVFEYYKEDDFFEIAIYHNDVLVGHAALIQMEDLHVGDVMAICHQFMDRDHRNQKDVWKKVLEMAEIMTKRLGLDFLVWSHIKGNFRTIETYKKVT